MKKIYTCAVNGITGKVGKYSAMCGKIRVNGNQCGAHGNMKCEHKRLIAKAQR